MGASYSVTCRECGHGFNVSEGGGFTFHLLKCDTCGCDRSVSFEELGEIHLRYIKGMRGPYCVVTAARDKAVQEEYPGEPIDESEYHKLAEKTLEACKCGGSFRFNAPRRCPECRSTELETDPNGMMMLYD